MTHYGNRFASDPVQVEDWTRDECKVHLANGDMHIVDWPVAVGIVNAGIPKVVTYQVGIKRDRDSRSTSFLYPRSRDIAAAVDSARQTMEALGNGSWVIVSVTDEF